MDELGSRKDGANEMERAGLLELKKKWLKGVWALGVDCDVYCLRCFYLGWKDKTLLAERP